MERYNDGTKTVNPGGKVMRIHATFDRYRRVPAFTEKCVSITDGVQKLVQRVKECGAQSYHIKTATILVGGAKVARIVHRSSCYEVLRLDPYNGELTDDVLYDDDERKKSDAEFSRMAKIRKSAKAIRQGYIIDQFRPLIIAFAGVIAKVCYNHPEIDFETKKMEELLAREDITDINDCDFEVVIKVPMSDNFYRAYGSMMCETRQYTFGPGFQLRTHGGFPTSSDTDDIQNVARLMLAYADMVDRLRVVFDALEEVPSIPEIMKKLTSEADGSEETCIALAG